MPKRYRVDEHFFLVFFFSFFFALCFFCWLCSSVDIVLIFHSLMFEKKKKTLERLPGTHWSINEATTTRKRNNFSVQTEMNFNPLKWLETFFFCSLWPQFSKTKQKTKLSLFVSVVLLLFFVSFRFVLFSALTPNTIGRDKTLP